MKQEIITVRADTVEDALKKASSQLNVSPDLVGYQIVDKGKRGWFSSRPAVILAYVQDENKEIDEKSFPIWLDDLISDEQENPYLGTIWVENGIIQCKNGIYNFPLLTPCEGLELRINGNVVTEKTVVSEEDFIEVKILPELVESNYHLYITDDKMEVFLEVNPGYSLQRNLLDLPPSKDLVLEVSETKIEGTGILENDVLKQLTQLGVCVGIDKNAIHEACQSKELVRVSVAKGISPIPGSDGELDLLYQKKQKEKQYLKLNDSVDWKENTRFVSVKSGDVIAIPIPSKKGVPGSNVFGESVHPDEVYDAEVIAGDGTTVYGLDQYVVATESGRLEIKKVSSNVYKFRVLPQYVHNGNVNFRTGNLRFNGDIYVMGDVEEGMIIEAGGSLHVLGTVLNSEIHVNGDAVFSGAVTSSTVLCGYSHQLLKDILPSLQSIHKSLMQMINAIGQLQTTQSFSQRDINIKGLQPIIKLLTDKKFTSLPLSIRNLINTIEQDRDYFDSELLQVLSFLEKVFLQLSPIVKELSQLEVATQKIDSILLSVQNDTNQKYLVKAGSLTNCKVKAIWDVEIEQFVFSSEIFCKGHFEVKGLLRGGRIEAGISIKANEIGTNGGAITRLLVQNEDGFVKSQIVLPDTHITISDYQYSHKILDEKRNVLLKINPKSNKLSFE